MKDWLILRLDAPMFSFGGVAVDNFNVTAAHPQRSMITGLLANALGWSHGDAEALDALQARLVIGARRDHGGEVLRDFATVDLGQEHLSAPGWTTWGKVERRGGGSSDGTHIRYRDYLVDSVFTVVVRVEGESAPDLDALEAAMRRPARPLFLGRKPCLPSGPILRGRVKAESARDALESVPWPIRDYRDRTTQAPALHAWLPATAPDGPDDRIMPVADRRDWENQIHTGRSWVERTLLTPREVTHEP